MRRISKVFAFSFSILSNRLAGYWSADCWSGTLGLTLAVLPLACTGSQSADALESAVKGSTHLSGGGAIAQAETNAEIASGNAAILDAIASTQVVYLAENHNSSADHLAQLDIIKALDETNELAIGLEMFQRPFQSALDSYLAGTITEAELVEQSEYKTRWGFDWEFYAPVLRYAKDNQIPVVALNTPTEATRQVAREGLDSLKGELLQYVPPVAEVDTTNEAYRASVAQVFGDHGHGSSLNFDNFFAAQVLWDETMAESIVKQLSVDAERQIVVLAGEGHIAFDYGIPSRVQRRLPTVDQASVRLSPADQAVISGFADFVWITP
ncbi:MAG: ChaN family lipoprotein [Phormidesmis sp.]